MENFDVKGFQKNLDAILNKNKKQGDNNDINYKPPPNFINNNQATSENPNTMNHNFQNNNNHGNRVVDYIDFNNPNFNRMKNPTDYNNNFSQNNQKPVYNEFTNYNHSSNVNFMEFPQNEIAPLLDKNQNNNAYKKNLFDDQPVNFKYNTNTYLSDNQSFLKSPSFLALTAMTLFIYGLIAYFIYVYG